MAGKKDIKDLLWRLESEGWRIEKTTKHIKCYHPVGGFISVSSTPRCQHAANQAWRDAKKLNQQNRSRL